MGLYRTGMSSSGGGSITVDDQLSTTSENPVQNKVITNALNDKQAALTAGTGIDITNNTISIDSSSMSGYQRHINFDIADVSNWSDGYDGELRYAVLANGSSLLYKFTADLTSPDYGWKRVYEVNISSTPSSTTVNVPLTNIVISSTDIGEGVQLDAGTLYLVVDP